MKFLTICQNKIIRCCWIKNKDNKRYSNADE